MRPVWIASGIALAWAALGATRQAERFAATAPNGNSIRVAGVCQFVGGVVKCWKPDGTPDQGDADIVNAFFVADPNKRLPLAYRGRTRIVLLREVARRKWQRLTIPSVRDSDGRVLESTGVVGTWEAGEDTTSMYWYYPPDSESVLDLSVQTWADVVEKTRLELKVGATALLGGLSLRIVSIQPVDRSTDKWSSPWTPPDAPEWDVSISYPPNSPPAQPLTIYGSAFDFGDNLIDAVDPSGNPVPWTFSNAFQQILERTGTNQNPKSMRCRANPARVKFVTLGAYYPATLTIAGVHLEPNRPANGW